MNAGYRRWLDEQKYAANTIVAQLVASDSDAKAKAAARMVPNLTLRKYSIRFTFSDRQA
jgi:hypothetical protein